MGALLRGGRRLAAVGALLLACACTPPAQPMQPPQAPEPTVYANGLFSGPMPTVDLPIQDITQQTPVWCWAAVSQQIIMASRGPQQTPPQCALVAIANNADPQICCNQQDRRCLRTGSIPQIQGLSSRFGGRASNYAPPTDPLTLYRTLAQGHAVIIGVSVGQGQGHVVVARGMSFVQTQEGWQPMVHINDPMAYYTQPVPFQQIARAWVAAIVID